MRNREELDIILGPTILQKLFKFVQKGTISKELIKSLADEMKVTTTFKSYKDKDPFNPLDTFKAMLDEERLKIILVYLLFAQDQNHWTLAMTMTK